MPTPNDHWQFWIDRGGTFTDIVARRPDGRLVSRKLLSENPERYRDAALQGITEILQAPEHQGLAGQVAVLKMGTTVGTNALLERTGEPTALAITRGFRDCLRIGYQNRPDIFALNIQLPELLYRQVLEIHERINAHGKVLQELDLCQARKALQAVYDSGIRALAIVLLHAWRYPAHEDKLAELAGEIGFTQISVSHRVSPLMKIVSRGDTTVVDAYLSPLLKRYIAQISAGLQDATMNTANSTRLMFMQSNGGLIDASVFQGKDSILSGPAGGIVAAVAVSARAGFGKIIAFDMGGTSTDVAHYAGELERRFETQVAGVRMCAAMMHIHTIAAGGGSILHFDGMRCRVGPASAGANPGPACYRRSGPLTVTDANVMLGKLPLFPKLFGPEGNLPPDEQRVAKLFSELAVEMRQCTGVARTAQQVAEGFLDIAVENMAAAIKKISVQQGYDIAGYTLCCYGAAGGQHACKVADRLGMTRVLLHPLAGVLSAYGMGQADLRLLRDQAVEQPWQAVSDGELQHIFADLERQGRQAMLEQGIAAGRMRAIARMHIRYQGTDTSLQVPFADKQAMHSAFEQQYRRRFGFIYSDRELVLETASVEIVGSDKTGEEQQDCSETAGDDRPVMVTRLFSGNQFHDAPVYRRSHLPAGTILAGPAIIVEATATTVVEPGWQGEITQCGDLLLTRTTPLPRQLAIGTSVDPVMLEIFNKLFMSIAEQMGFVLQNTASSVNIKERLDFSCALFNARGRLIANAPHIPVHLGSMGEAVRAIVQREGDAMQPGDVFLGNSPYHGGTHLPDITVVTPVFDSDGQLLFIVASRGHHADIGGITPGSMPADSSHINQEGLLCSTMKIVAAGQFQEQRIRRWLASGTCPARNPEQNIADLQAQIAANEKGLQELLNMVAHYSLPTVQAYMGHVQDNAAAVVSRALRCFAGGRFVQRLDDGAEIVVLVSVDPDKGTARIDFTGTSVQLRNNFNAPAAVCRAAVLYVIRTLVDDDIPLNAGCLEPLEIIIPEGSLLDPRWPAAVVAGNVETSQHVVDALYGALGVLAASQGTMNNFSFGNDDYQYYETICGGTGAGADFSGCDAVQSHMTNSRMTDPEVLEWRFPVLVEEFSIRSGSGGQGLHCGGNGVRRHIRFLQDMTISILSSHRKIPPFGMQGGEPGACGRNTLIHGGGEKQRLPGCVQVAVQAGDSILIETPGGGGYGKQSRQSGRPGIP